ncbi:Pyruvate decarboxylase 1 [Elasticomyces elasticus]|nr:Pyruvate decarboxylase 1 [Elasticomyces elasticus]KAK4928387.1 Pyruvate decarboxylase 1 [Elasticomyces elasticus]KAK5767188.1 Pyruvate decarboxylase 1 [Elasticomyces elasticus]
MSQVKVGDYLFQRLAQLGIKTCWGVPGDYELALLDLIGDAGIDFRGNANELIASYAADGYSRINGAGAFVTTFGPGELSAYCGHAGAMYHEMVKKISVDTAVLTDLNTAGSDIDRCLNTMLYESRPVYIGVPVDMSHQQISGEGLKTPLKRELPPNDKGEEDKIAKEIMSMIKSAKKPVIIMDGSAVRNNLTAESNRIAEITGWTFVTTCMGKGAANEELPNYSGIYEGAGSIEEVRKVVEDDSDFVLWIGSFRTDFNTGEMTDFVDEKKTVDLQRFFTKIGSKKYDVGMHGVLKALLSEVEADSSIKAKDSKVEWDPYPLPEAAKEKKELKQDFLWSVLDKIIKPGDLVVGETGTSAFGLAAVRFPKGATGYNQTVFGSIGYAGPSFTGALKAAKEAGIVKRGILITGEGSLQLTPMCFADLLKLDLKPLIFVLNNNGYTVERLIHGKTASYNTLPVWDYKQLCTVFGPEFPSKYYGPIKTCDELEKLLDDPELHRGDCFQLVELILGELDAPWSVGQVTAKIEEFNSKNAPPKDAGMSMGG